MLNKILIVVAVLVAGFIAFVAMQPSEFKITRAITINAAPAAVFPHVNDLHQWEAWSPWMKLDPNMQKSYDGPAAGEGSSHSWAGNHDVGEGKMTITKSHEPDLVELRLDFKKPMEATNMTVFNLKAEGPATLVTWEMTGTNGFLSKAICLFMNMDKLVGGDFEKGLASLKQIVESTPK